MYLYVASSTFTTNTVIHTAHNIDLGTVVLKDECILNMQYI